MKGRGSNLADALSRKRYLLPIISSYKSDIKTRVQQYQLRDQF